MIRLLYFAWVRTQIGIDEESLTLPKVPFTVAELLDWLPSQSPAYALLEQQRSLLRVAVNQEFAGSETLIHPGDEVAVFPPVTGG